MNRKRLKKLRMAQGMSRNEAEDYCRVVKFINSHPKLVQKMRKEPANEH